MNPVPLKTTQYGLSTRLGGWDRDGDSGTDNWMGCFGNKLNLSSCALTESAERTIAEALPPDHPARVTNAMGKATLRPHTLLKVTWAVDQRLVLYRTFDDRAPENDPRLDIFNPWAFNNHIPDFGSAEVA